LNVRKAPSKVQKVPITRVMVGLNKSFPIPELLIDRVRGRIGKTKHLSARFPTRH